MALFIFCKKIFILGMHQVNIEIIYLAGFQLLLKERTDFFFRIEEHTRKLVCQNKALARISRRYAVADCRFALSLEINSRSIKVIEPLCHEEVDHLFEFIVIDLAVFHRETHTAEAEILFCLGKNAVFIKSVHFLFSLKCIF